LAASIDILQQVCNIHRSRISADGHLSTDGCNLSFELFWLTISVRSVDRSTVVCRQGLSPHLRTLNQSPNNHQSRRISPKTPRESRQNLAFPARSSNATRSRSFPRAQITQQKLQESRKAKVEGRSGNEKGRFCSRAALLQQARPVNVNITGRLLNRLQSDVQIACRQVQAQTSTSLDADSDSTAILGRQPQVNDNGLGRVEELLVAEELWNDHKKLIFFPFSSAANCTNRPLEINQRLGRRPYERDGPIGRVLSLVVIAHPSRSERDDHPVAIPLLDLTTPSRS
ncbi:hypothetical protein Taro_036556, partial [Colocasia esculenta]|nr:hypothetical protein [Colocasia esculenta]